jgi:ribonuclease G
LDGIVHKNFGVIVRTAAEGKLQEDIQRDLLELMEKWKTIPLGLKNANTGDKILSELDKTTSILRDLLNKDFEKIIVNNASVFNDINNFLTKVAPEKKKIVELIQNENSPFDTYGVTKQIKSSFGKTSTTTGGSYIVIEHTEAMTVIDVNSGNRAKGDDQDSVAFKVNSEVCEEIARQLRLRDIGGLVVIDFIDMKNVDFRKKIFERITELMRKDTARHTILPISKFGIMQITRERTKPVVTVEPVKNARVVMVQVK